MDYLELGKLINIGIEIDWGNMILTIRLGPLTIKNVKIPAFQELRKDIHFVEGLLTDQFITRGVMWVDFAREEVEDCVKSLQDLEQSCLERKKAFVATGSSADSVLATALEGWAVECNQAVRSFKEAIEFEKTSREIEFDSEFILRAHNEIPRILGNFRKDTYPIVEMFIQLLSEENLIHQQAVEKLKQGQDLIVKHYGISVADLRKPEYLLEKA